MRRRSSGGSVRTFLTMTDRAAGGLARVATTLGQCALIGLGVHLAADSLDDRLIGLELPLPVTAAAWTALVVELLAIGLLWNSFLLSPRQPKLSWSRLRAALGIHALAISFSLAGVLLAGAWSMAMAVEDNLPASPWAPPASGLLGVVVLVRFGLPAFLRAVACLEPPRRHGEGLLSALVLVPVGLLAWLGALPISWLWS